jgi:hypothetical protein
MRCASHRLLHQLAMGGHGAVGVLAVLMTFYNAKRGNAGLACLYAGLAIFEGFRVADHIEDARA